MIQIVLFGAKINDFQTKIKQRKGAKDMQYHLISIFVGATDAAGIHETVVCKKGEKPLCIFELFRAMTHKFSTSDIDIFGVKKLCTTEISEIPEESIVFL